MKKLSLIFTFTFVHSFVGQTFVGQTFVQRYAEIVNQVSQDNITNHLTEFENLGVKYRGTEALENTYQWLVNSYKTYGYTDEQITTDTYSYSGSMCKNLIITKTGTTYPNTYIIVCGHYDSINGKGTNDNGSGIVSILEMARLIRDINTEYSIKFINFSGEEDNLKGSEHYVNTFVNATSPKMDIRLVFNLDEVGGVTNLVNDKITCERDENNSPSTNNILSDTYTRELMKCVELYSPLKAVLSYAYASDYMPFQSNNEVITGFFETNETLHKHTITDLLVNMDPVYNYKVAQAALGGLLHFAKAETVLTLNKLEDSNRILFYLNMPENILQIHTEGVSLNNYKVELYDINGKKVIDKSFYQPQLIEKLEVASLLKGVYLVVFQSDNFKVKRKILVR
ncbi:M28 family peptidase [Flavobacterium columnare]|uniref:M28 family peptidase n=1 Tax=Flavobacterium columnare TaxID=996 RepID=UPI00177F1F93|nr:M28 family peptidase [Flavobacterium columnare]QOG90602.1 M28 family peptidase [Flavobacterium columnare]QOG93256.1 M28 family peptidase [Flavobacterium columnare]QOG95923.1 M28 family peptidase [Flavobacterium columnare]QOG98583.1 M28 family peptidase [Flavobacterium columnare]QOH01242.1 M28 family peptidase [Flavobacterium columnare]